MQSFGIEFIGTDAENGHKLLWMLTFVLVIVLPGPVLKKLPNAVLPGGHRKRSRFWTRQVIGMRTALLVIISLISIGVDNPAKLTTTRRPASARLAFALQRVITFNHQLFRDAAWQALYRGPSHFDGWHARQWDWPGLYPQHHHGDGSAASGTKCRPGRVDQKLPFTGRIVSGANSKIFDEPMLNDTRNLPFI